MRRLRLSVLGLVLVFAGCGEGGAPVIEPGGLALVGARLIDGTGSAPIEDSVVVIRDGRIENAGARDATAVPAGAEVIDVTGKTIIPGLVNLHVHYRDGPEEIERQKQKLSEGRSVLDELLSQTKILLKNAPAADRERLQEYFESVRTAEKNLAEEQVWFDRPKPEVQAKSPLDIHDKTDLVGRIRLLFNLVPLIIQTDSSRVISVVIQNNHGVPQVEGVDSEHHNLSHHGRDPKRIQQLLKIERAIMGCFDEFLTAMKAKREAGSTLLVALFILTILSLLGLSLATLVTLEAKSALRKRDMLRAQENARTGIYQALQKIQEYAGPDQRATARAEIMDTHHQGIDPDPEPADARHATAIQDKNLGKQYWTGVFEKRNGLMRNGWLVSRQPTGGISPNLLQLPRSKDFPRRRCPPSRRSMPIPSRKNSRSRSKCLISIPRTARSTPTPLRARPSSRATGST